MKEITGVIISVAPVRIPDKEDGYIIVVKAKMEESAIKNTVPKRPVNVATLVMPEIDDLFERYFFICTLKLLAPPAKIIP